MSRVLRQQQTRDAFKSGIDAMAAAVTPTLGPLTGVVALDGETRGGSPELLDDGGTIARRILQLEDRDADAGAMLLRETLWQQRKRYGDGAATTAALYQTVYDEGHRFIRAGGDAMLLRGHLEAGMRLMLATLERQARPLTEAAEIERLALSICGDAAIAATLADILDTLGPHAPVEAREGGRELRSEFFLGAFWESAVPSRMVFDGVAGGRLELRDTAWLISDFEVDDLDALVKLVMAVVKDGCDSLAIVAKSFSEQIIAAQGANRQRDDFTLVYIEPRGLVDEQEAALEDLALLTGGRALRNAAGHSFDALDAGCLGRSELAWLDRNRFGIIAGAGAESKVGRDIEALESRFGKSADERQRAILRTRIGRLRGGSAVVYAGGSSESEMRFQMARIERTLAALREALLEGSLPGGGAALLRCVPGLREASANSGDLHRRAACRILAEAAIAPCRQLLQNAGHAAPGAIIADILASANGTGYDLLASEFVKNETAGALDSAAAMLGAVRNGIGGAALALTVETLVHRLNPPLAIEPGGLPSSAGMGNIELK